MNFEEFCSYVKESIYEYLPENHRDYRIVMHDVNKTNIGKLRALTMILPERNAGPTQYMEPFFEAYQKGIPLEEILAVIAERQIKNERVDPGFTEDEIDMISDFNSVKDRIMICAVGCEKNREMLEHVPHKVMGDIAATYRVYIGKGEEMEMSCLIDNRLMKHYGVTAGRLHNLALNNSMKAMPAQILGLNAMIEEFAEDGEKAELPDVGMMVVTNKQRCHGAAVAFYPDIFEMAGIPMEQFYIAPSSVHELMLLPKSMMSLDGANEMIKEINESCVEMHEVLSDLVHEYDPVSRQLVIGGTLLQRNREMEEREAGTHDVLPAMNAPAWCM